jgi:sulfite reductase alpha subunit-like flavoprotein
MHLTMTLRLQNDHIQISCYYTMCSAFTQNTMCSAFKSQWKAFNMILELNFVITLRLILYCVQQGTAGEGDMPGSAESFWEFINEPGLVADESEKPLSNVKLFSFGLGDTSYRYFNKAALDIEKRLVELGAEAQVECGMGNDQDDDKYETAFEEWLPEFWKYHGTTEEPDGDLIPEPVFEMYPEMENWQKQTVAAPSTKFLNLEFCERITPHDYDRIIYWLRFDRKGREYPFLLGDAMSIYPQNNPDKIKSFLDSYLPESFDQNQCYRVIENLSFKLCLVS